ELDADRRGRRDKQPFHNGYCDDEAFSLRRAQRDEVRSCRLIGHGALVGGLCQPPRHESDASPAPDILNLPDREQTSPGKLGYLSADVAGIEVQSFAQRKQVLAIRPDLEDQAGKAQGSSTAQVATVKCTSPQCDDAVEAANCVEYLSIHSLTLVREISG